ncbi:MAG: lipocalin-like domain-containing protein [Propionivibrio sp.]
MRRRDFVLSLAALSAFPAFARRVAADPATDFAPVVAGRSLVFPRDHGAHPDFRTEWWYATGWLSLPDGSPLGFQTTFFRVRTGIGEDNPSSFAPSQLILAHAAIADPRLGRLRHDQRIGRVSRLGRAGFEAGRTEVWIGDWRFHQQDGAYRAEVQGEDFSYALTLVAEAPPMQNGDRGFSMKAPQARHASYYYSRPQLGVSGTVTLDGRQQPVTGRAWLDHEWSSELLPEAAQGWDWVGLNLADGGALMVFRLRRADGTPLWAAATLREASGTRTFAPGEVSFAAQRRWQSVRTGITYPVEWRIRVGTREFQVSPLFDDQELDSRLSTGNVYWEGAVSVSENEREVGRGYLEMTGYGERIRIDRD